MSAGRIASAKSVLTQCQQTVLGSSGSSDRYNTARSLLTQEILSLRAAIAAQTVNLQGTMTLGDYTGNSTGIEVAIEIRDPGQPTARETHLVAIDAGGGFSLTSGVPAGTYDLSAKASHWLRKTLSSVALIAGLNSVNFTLTNGDSDGDNEITTSDLANVLFAMDAMPGDPNWLAEADLDGDAEVTTSDLATVLLNMDQMGDE